MKDAQEKAQARALFLRRQEEAREKRAAQEKGEAEAEAAKAARDKARAEALLLRRQEAARLAKEAKEAKEAKDAEERAQARALFLRRQEESKVAMAARDKAQAEADAIRRQEEAKSAEAARERARVAKEATIRREAEEKVRAAARQQEAKVAEAARMAALKLCQKEEAEAAERARVAEAARAALNRERRRVALEAQALEARAREDARRAKEQAARAVEAKSREERMRVYAAEKAISDAKNSCMETEQSFHEAHVSFPYAKALRRGAELPGFQALDQCYKAGTIRPAYCEPGKSSGCVQRVVPLPWDGMQVFLRRRDRKSGMVVVVDVLEDSECVYAMHLDGVDNLRPSVGGFTPVPRGVWVTKRQGYDLLTRSTEDTMMVYVLSAVRRALESTWTPGKIPIDV